MSAVQSFTTVAAVLPVLRVVWSNAPAAAYVVHSHIFCSFYNADGECMECDGEGCTSCLSPETRDMPHVYTSVAGVHLNSDAATAHARKLLPGLFISYGGSAAVLARTKVSSDLQFDLGFEQRDGSGKVVFAASLNDRGNNRMVGTTVSKTTLVGVSKTRAEKL